MQFKMIIFFVIGLALSTTLKASEADQYSFYLQKVSGQEELKSLKTFHDYNEIFDNYHLGGTSPETSKDKGK